MKLLIMQSLLYAVGVTGCYVIGYKDQKKGSINMNGTGCIWTWSGCLYWQPCVIQACAIVRVLLHWTVGLNVVNWEPVVWVNSINQFLHPLQDQFLITLRVSAPWFMAIYNRQYVVSTPLYPRCLRKGRFLPLRLGQSCSVHSVFVVPWKCPLKEYSSFHPTDATILCVGI
jgi:hypothetical protein